MKRHLLRASILTVLMAGVYAAAQQAPQKPETEKPVKVADGVWYELHNNIGKFGSNVAWIEFKDYVVVIDTAFPLGAEEAIRNIKETTGGKRIKYAIVTHYHADHSFGTGVFAKEGATIVAHENARRQYLERNVENYLKTSEKDPVYAKYKPFAPDVTFTDKFVIDDGERRAEIHFFGHAHTTGCIFTFLPKEKIVFTGDACVNGPFNYMGDSDSASWINVLGQVQGLGAETVVPGHGAVAKKDLLQTQKQYFVELRAQVAALVKEGKPIEDVRKAVDIPMWKQWTGEAKMNISNIEHVFKELSRGGSGANPERERKVRRLMELTGAAGAGHQMMDAMMKQLGQLPGLPEGFAEKFMKKAVPAKLVDLTVPIYVKHLDEETLDAVITFYETESGRRMLKAQPMILQESMDAGRKWGEDLAREVLKELEEKK